MPASTPVQPPRAADPPQSADQCYSCQEDLNTPNTNPIHLPCNHAYCPECFEHLFRSGLTSISSFPPSCCNQPIDFNTHKSHLSDELIRQYLTMLETKLTNTEIPCATPACKHKTKHYHIFDEWGICPGCLSSTCGRCHQLQDAHQIQSINSQRTCPPPEIEDETLLRLASQRGWRACPHCGHMV